MARVMYFDCFAGAAGDMVLGALLDAGLPLDELRRAMGTLGIGHELTAKKVLRAGITATHVDLVAGPDHDHDHHQHGHDHPHQDHHHDHHHSGHEQPHSHGHRSLAEIAHLIGHSALSAAGKERAVQLFRRIGEAEAAIHDMSIDEVHLHEVGAVDSIIDIVGAVFAFEWFGIDDVVASPMNVGGGTVEIAHGVFPVPAPATLRLLAGVPGRTAPAFSRAGDADRRAADFVLRAIVWSAAGDGRRPHRLRRRHARLAGRCPTCCGS